MGTVMVDTSVFGALNRANSGARVAKILKELQGSNELVVPRAAYTEILKTPGDALRNAQLQQIQDFQMKIQPDVAHADYVEVYKQWSELGSRQAGVGYTDMKVIADVRAYAKLNPTENVEFFTVEKMVNNKAGIESTYGVKFSAKCSFEANVGEIVPYDPVALGVRPPAPPAPAAPDLPPPVPETPLPNPGVGSTETFMSAGKAGLVQGLKGLLSAETAVGVAATVFMAACDMAAMKDAVRRIQTKFIKEGFAKGVAAGAMGWTDSEVASNALYRVTNFRVQGLADPGGYLTMSYILKLAETVENYAVGIGYYFAAAKSLQWKKDWCAKGFGLLAKYGYNFGDDDDVLFTYEVLSKVAWAMRADSDAIVAPAIRFS